jgi:hypothetical protein
MVFLLAAFMVVVIITLGILWMLERPRARLQEGDASEGGSEVQRPMDDIDREIVALYYARKLLQKGHAPGFGYLTEIDIIRRYSISLEELELRRDRLHRWLLGLGDST